MSLTPSNMLPLGTVAPDFKLPDTISGKKKALAKLKSPIATVIMFICNHCPYVIHINEELVKLAKEYQKKGVSFIAISSNDVKNYPADSPAKMKAHAKKVGYSFPYLYDETQEVAKAYDAACTPDFYVFNRDMELMYRGRMDASRPNSGVPVTGEDLRAAIDLTMVNRPIAATQHPSMGCNIKWKK